MQRNSILAGAVAAAALLAAPLYAEDVEFQSWTFAEETGRAAIQSLADSFTADTGLTVELQGYAWGDMTRTYMLRSGSGTLPDVGQSQERLLPMLQDIEGIVDFNDIFSEEELSEMFEPAFLAMGNVNGRQIGLPWIGGSIGWVANMEVLEAAGVTEVPTTVEDFHAALEAVRDAVPGSVPFGFATRNNASIVVDYLVWLRTFGGDIVQPDGTVTANAPEAVATLTWLVEAMNDRLIAPEIDRPDARRLFGQGAMAFYLDAPQARTFARQFSGRDEAIDAAVRPIQGPVLEAGDTPVSLQWGHVFVAFGEDNAAADSPAVRFIMHALADENLIDYATGQSALPTTRSGAVAPSVAEDTFLSDWLAATVAPTPHSIASLDEGAEVTDVIGEELQAAILGQRSPQEAADSMQSRLMAILGN